MFFVGFSKRMFGGLRLGAGMRLTKKNFAYMVFVLAIFYISYYTIAASIWLMVGVVYFFFVWPIKKIYELIKGRQPAAPERIQ